MKMVILMTWIAVAVLLTSYCLWEEEDGGPWWTRWSLNSFVFLFSLSWPILGTVMLIESLLRKKNESS